VPGADRPIGHATGTRFFGEQLIRRLRHVVQNRLLPSVRWADILQPSTRDRRCPAAWQQYWQQSRRRVRPRKDGSWSRCESSKAEPASAAEPVRSWP